MQLNKLFFIFAIALLLVSCSKTSIRDEDTSTNTTEDYAFAQAMVYDAFKIVHQAANSSKGIAILNLADTTSLFGCDTIIVDTTVNPMTIAVQFNGTCNERTGAISATFSSKYDVLGCITTINFTNYSFRNDTVKTGTISYIYNGLTGTSPNYSYTADKIKIENSSSKTMSFSGNQTLSVASGESTAIVTDDSYTIAGSASGTTYRGNEYIAVITNDLTLLGNCNWISAGIATVKPENKTTRTIDFGSGCDDKATVTINSVATEIVVP